MARVPAGHPEKPKGEDGFKLLERMNGGHHEELARAGFAVERVERVFEKGRFAIVARAEGLDE